MKKKRFKFSVLMSLHELSDVPFLSGMLFVKVKLCDGGSFSAKSTRQGISNHTAVWNEEFNFDCRMTASASDGLLNDCVCRLFIRMEAKGGKSYEKLGFVDVNLAQYACAGLLTKRLLLHGSSNSKKQYNSVLKVGVNVSLVSGDPCFKRPPLPEVKLTDCLSRTPRNEGVAGRETAGATAGLLSAGSAPSLQTPSHSRQSSQGSGRLPSSHSRQPSQTSTISLPSRPHSDFHATPTSICDEEEERPVLAATRQRNLSDCPPQSGRRSGMLTSTHEAVVDQIILSQSMMEGDAADIHEGCSSSRSSLQLFVSKNGQATVSGTDIRFSGGYQQVVVTQAH